MREPEGRDCTAHAPQLDAYADGALEPAEAARLEAHLAHCPRCRETLAEIRACKAAVAALPPPALPPQAIERHLAAALERLRTEPMPAAPPRIRRLRRHAPLLWRAAAATLLACVLGLALLVGRPPAVGLGWAPGSFAQLRYRPLALEPVARPIAPARPDLGNVAYADTLALSAAGRARLATRGALALEAPSPDALSLYAAARARGTPVLWTADLAVAATARLLADVRAHLERDRLAPALTAVLRGLALQLARLADQLEAGPAREAAFEAAAIAHTGLALLGAAHDLPPLPQRWRDRLEQERRAIGAAAAIAPSPLTGVRLDYTAFASLAADRDARLERALRWLGMGMLPLDREDGARAALALVYALLEADGGRLATRYQQIVEVLDFLEGEPDGWSPARLVPWLRGRIGPRLERSTLADPGRRGDLLAALAALPGPRIPGPEGRRPLASLLGQRYDLEAEIAARTSWPAVGTARAPRLDPGGLDTLAVFGFPDALQQLRADGTWERPGYARAIEALRRSLHVDPSLPSPQRFARQDLGSLWLFALRGLDPVGPEDAYPPGWRAETGRARRLLAALGGLTHTGFLERNAPAPPPVQIAARRRGPGAAAAETDAARARPGTEGDRAPGAPAVRDAGALAAAHDVATAPLAPPARVSPRPGTLPAVDPAPRLFHRLAAMARAVARALEGFEGGAARARGTALALDLRSLASTLEHLSTLARARIEDRPPPPAAIEALRDPVSFCRRFLPGPSFAARVVAHIERRGRTAVVHRQRIVAGFDPLLVLLPSGGAADRPLVAAAGVVLRVRSLDTERRIEPDQVGALLDLPPPAWARPLYGDDD